MKLTRMIFIAAAFAFAMADRTAPAEAPLPPQPEVARVEAVKTEAPAARTPERIILWDSPAEQKPSSIIATMEPTELPRILAPTPQPEKAGESPRIAIPIEPDEPTSTPAADPPTTQTSTEPAPEPHRIATPIASELEFEPVPGIPIITCPPEPTLEPVPDIPIITCPPEPAATPATSTEVPSIEQHEPAPEPILEPSLEPTPEPEPAPTPEPTPNPTEGYALCSCDAKLAPSEVIPHMKQHALNGESHSYRAF